MLDINYDLSASECPGCRRAVLVPVHEPRAHCYFCGREVPPPDPQRFSNVNAGMQRLSSFVRDSRLFERHNTNTAVARETIEELGRYLQEILRMNEASIRYGYYGKPGEYERKMLARTRAFLDAMEAGYARARTEVDAADASPGPA